MFESFFYISVFDADDFAVYENAAGREEGTDRGGSAWNFPAWKCFVLSCKSLEEDGRR
ncbi:hypothetical protein lbkm_1732 [Lachnospiraceae bacterium KM106-2]|nr:hypothetical protein lbkm_1732 [Lachnospiraceae bacterium KM106-2]